MHDLTSFLLSVNMEPIVVLFLCASVIAVLIRWADHTDVPFIKGLPHLRGVPIFGNLFLLGKHHARNSARLAKTVGDVFQVRLGNRVCLPVYNTRSNLDLC